LTCCELESTFKRLLLVSSREELPILRSADISSSGRALASISTTFDISRGEEYGVIII